MSGRLGRRFGAAACSAALLVTVAGCGGEEDTSTPAPSSAPASSSDQPSPTVSDSASATPTPAAATGAVISLDNIQVTLTPEWEGERDQSETGSTIAVSSPGSRYSLLLGQDALPGISLDDAADTYNEFSTYPTKQERLPDVTIAGRQWFHLAGQVSDVIFAEDYGTLVGDLQLVVSLETSPAVSPRKRAEVMDAIMASVVITP